MSEPEPASSNESGKKPENAKNKEKKEKPPKTKFFTCMLVHAVLAAAIGSGFQHGYNGGVVANVDLVIKTWINDTLHTTEKKIDVVWSATVSIMSIGGIVGGAITKAMTCKFGRRMSLIINNGVAVLGAVLMGTSKFINAYWLLIIGRLVIGVNVGLNAGVAPMYLSEISPINIRGAMGSMYQLVITISILISNGLSVNAVLGSETLWPVLFYLLIIIAAYQVIALIFSPESPKYLLEKGDVDSATKVSIQLCGEKAGLENVEAIKHELAQAENQPKVTFRDMLHTKKYRTPLTIMCLLMAAQQLSGINAVINYSRDIFSSAKLDFTSTQVATVGLGIVNVLVTIVGVYLVEKLGRKPLLAIGFGGMTITTTAIMVCLFFVERSKALSYVTIVLVYSYMICFAIGAGAIPWILGSELFTTEARPLGLSIAVPTNWLFNFIVSLSFPPLKSLINAWVFCIFIICNALSFVYFMYAIPETKNKPIEEITAKFE